jgi:hypothetical protein
VQVADKLTDAQQGQFYHAIMHYALYGKKAKLSPPLDAFFIFVQPSIDKSNKRKNAGANGGKKSSKTQAKRKQNTSKTQANPEQNITKEKEKVKVKEKVKEKVKDNTLINSSIINVACECERIAGIFPKAKIGDWRMVVEAIGNAIQREVDRGSSVSDAVSLVELGTKAYAEAAKEMNKRYLCQAVNFYNNGIYNNDPETWKNPDDNNNKGENTNDSSYTYTSKLS